MNALIDLAHHIKKEGVSLATVRALATEARETQVGSFPDGARYLLVLGELMYREGRRIQDWPDPFRRKPVRR